MMFFFFNDTAPTEIYTLSLHDALPISSTAATTDVQTVIRGRALEIVDDRGRVRASLSVLPEDPKHMWKRSEEHTSELQSQSNLVCRLLLEKKKYLYLEVTPIMTLTTVL